VLLVQGEAPFAVQLGELLDKLLPHDPDNHWYQAPDIPPKKLANAIRKYGGEVAAENVLALGDGTAFGSAKNGVMLTARKICYNTDSGRGELAWDAVVSATVVGGFPQYGVEVHPRRGDTVRIDCVCFDAVQPALVNFLNQVGLLNRRKRA